MNKLELLAVKCAKKMANGFDAKNMELMARICKAMKKADNKLACLAADKMLSALNTVFELRSKFNMHNTNIKCAILVLKNNV